MSNNCINYEGVDNAPCKIIEYPTFDQYDKYNAGNFNDFIYKTDPTESGEYNYDQYKFDPDYINKISTEKFKLTHPQMFVPKYANYHNNFQGLLVYHGLGSGKTCTSILVGEAYKAFKQTTPYFRNISDDDMRPIVVVRASLIQNFKDELSGELYNNKETGCVSNLSPRTDKTKISYLMDKKISTSTAASKRLSGRLGRQGEGIIDSYWDIITHTKFIYGLVDRKNEDDLKDMSKKLKKGGRIVIIDEIQNLISESGTMYNTLINMMKLFSHNNRFIVLSATPIYDKPFEIGLVMNLLNPRIYFPSTKNDFDKLFIKPAKDNENKLEMMNMDLFYWMCSGYISYFSGGNPKDFPFKRVIEYHHVMGDKQLNVYVNKLADEIKDVFFSDDNKQPITPIESELSESVSQNYLTGVRQFCNIVFQSDVDRLDNVDKISKTKVVKDVDKLEWLKSHLDEVKDVLAKQGPKDVLDNVSTYSSKMATIAKMVLDSNHKSFIFSDLRCYGVDAMSIIMSAIGFVELEERHVKNEETVKAFYKNIVKIQKDEKRTVPVFTCWTGSIKDKDAYSKLVLGIYNDARENTNGQKLKVILGTDTIKEGISLFGVRDVHIMNPWWNESHFDQVVARAIRLYSHSHLDKNDQFVNIYRHLSVLPYYPKKMSKDEYKTYTTKVQKYETIQKRGFAMKTIDQHINNRSKVKKADSREFELVMKSSSVDCRLNRYGNLIRLTECLEPKYIDNKKLGYDLYYENNTTGKKYTKMSRNKKINYVDDLDTCIIRIPPDLDETVQFISSSSEKEVLSTTSEDTLFKITKEYIINENIDCERFNNFDFKAFKNESFSMLVDETKNYKFSKYKFSGSGSGSGSGSLSKDFYVKPIEIVLNSVYSDPYSINKVSENKNKLIACISKFVTKNPKNTKDLEKLSKFLKFSLDTNVSDMEDLIFKYIGLIIGPKYNDECMVHIRNHIMNEDEYGFSQLKEELSDIDEIDEETLVSVVQNVKKYYKLLNEIESYDALKLSYERKKKESMISKK